MDLARVELLALLLLQDWVLLFLCHLTDFFGLILQQVDGPAFLFLQVQGQDNSDNCTYVDPRVCLHELDHMLAHGNRLLVHVAAVDRVSLAVGVIHHGFDLP